MDALRAFAVVASERNMRRAAQTLNISQPPLSRKIRGLEASLGMDLFIRHSSGMELTAAGAQTLAVIQPLLRLADETQQKLDCLADAAGKPRQLGLTTAFEQDIFLPWLELWAKEYGSQPALTRKPSPALVRDVACGKLDAALVALPVDPCGLPVIDLDYAEPLIAALPGSWPEACGSSICLRQMERRPLFWFQRRRNSAFFDHMLVIFRENGFSPFFIEEPPEHDVLLARIAFGEGWALLPQSFARVTRAGVNFCPLAGGCSLRLGLGLVCRKNCPQSWHRKRNAP